MFCDQIRLHIVIVVVGQNLSINLMPCMAGEVAHVPININLEQDLSMGAYGPTVSTPTEFSLYGGTVSQLSLAAFHVYEYSKGVIV